MAGIFGDDINNRSDFFRELARAKRVAQSLIARFQQAHLHDSGANAQTLIVRINTRLGRVECVEGINAALPDLLGNRAKVYGWAIGLWNGEAPREANELAISIARADSDRRSRVRETDLG